MVRLIRWSVSAMVSESDVEIVASSLQGDEVARALDAALVHVMGHETQLLEALRGQILPTLIREPVGERLRHQHDAPAQS